MGVEKVQLSLETPAQAVKKSMDPDIQSDVLASKHVKSMQVIKGHPD